MPWRQLSPSWIHTSCGKEFSVRIPNFGLVKQHSDNLATNDEIVISYSVVIIILLQI